MIVFLDTNVLGLIAKPNKSFDESSDESYQVQQWFYGLLSKGVRVVTSTLCEYEFRRGLLEPSNKSTELAPGLIELNKLAEQEILEFIDVSREDSILAAQMWVDAQAEGLPTSDKKKIDIDVIISAQCLILQQENPGQKVIMATTNIKHISRYCEAANWQDIKL
jgi:predicted nucleic acid-binding protein